MSTNPRGFSVEVKITRFPGATVKYFGPGRVITIDAEVLATGMAIDLSSMKRWDPPFSATPITVHDKVQVIRHIQATFDDHKHVLSLEGDPDLDAELFRLLNLPIPLATFSCPQENVYHSVAGYSVEVEGPLTYLYSRHGIVTRVTATAESNRVEITDEGIGASDPVEKGIIHDCLADLIRYQIKMGHVPYKRFVTSADAPMLARGRPVVLKSSLLDSVAGYFGLGKRVNRRSSPAEMRY